MSLTNLALIASIISSVAVAASLIYLALQVHQNTRHARAQIQQARVTRLVEQMVGFSDADKCAAYIKGNGRDPTPDAIMERQFYMQCLAQLGTILDAFTQHQDGLLNDEQFEVVTETYRGWFQEPGIRQHHMKWKAEVAVENSDFLQFIDGLMQTRNQPASTDNPSS